MAEYNGWQNYETWAVALWLGNEEPFYLEARRLVKEGSSIGAAADSIKAWVTELCLEELKAPVGMASDLLGAALSEVNWVDVAESFKEED